MEVGLGLMKYYFDYGSCVSIYDKQAAVEVHVLGRLASGRL